MIDDHQESSRGLKQALAETAVSLVPPAELDMRRRIMADHLRQESTDKFDATYLDQQLAAHREAVTLMHSYRDTGDDERLRRHAAETAPIFEDHLERIRSLRHR